MQHRLDHFETLLLVDCILGHSLRVERSLYLHRGHLVDLVGTESLSSPRAALQKWQEKNCEAALHLSRFQCIENEVQEWMK